MIHISLCNYAVKEALPVVKRLPVLRDNQAHWLYNPYNQITSRVIEPKEEMLEFKKAVEVAGEPIDLAMSRGCNTAYYLFEGYR